MREVIRKLKFCMFFLVAVLLIIQGSAEAEIIEYKVTGVLNCRGCSDIDQLDGALYLAVYRLETTDLPIFDSCYASYCKAEYVTVAFDVSITSRPEGAPNISLSATGYVLTVNDFGTYKDYLSGESTSVYADGIGDLTLPSSTAYFHQSYFGGTGIAPLAFFSEGDVEEYRFGFLRATSPSNYNLEQATFAVVGLDPVQATQDLVNAVISLNLQQGIANSLDGKLDSAIGALEDANENNDQAAINKLEAFIAHVQAQRGNMIPEASADTLIAMAQEIIGLLQPQ